MAMVCVLCKMFCVIFLLICSLSSIYSSPDVNQYTIHSPEQKSLDYFSYHIQDENNVHVLQKRQAVDTGGSSTTPRPVHEVPVPGAAAAPSTSSTSQPATTPAVTPMQPMNTTVLLHKNLGENGAGIRKNYTSITASNNVTLLSTDSKSSSPVDIAVLKNNQSKEVDDDDLSFTNFSEEAVNKTLTKNNITKTDYDTHSFYNSTLTTDPTVGQKYWTDLRNKTGVKVNELLSQSHRRAATVRLSFDFPFYGHIVRNITIATGGFLYTGEYVHSWLAATQYIAPLMANFDTSLSNDSYVKYFDNGTSFTVQWEEVVLQDKPNDGNFTFEATLHSNGDIVFVYKNIPITIEDIEDEHHPVKVGLSDAYISDRTIFFVRRKTIYEYHRVNFNHGDIKNWTVIYLSALPTCLSNKDCVSCVSKPTSAFQCAWCPGINRCSSGMDRHRQDWLTRGCERKKISNETMCSAAPEFDSDIANTTGDAHSDILTYNTANAGDGNARTDRAQLDGPRQEPRITNSEKPVKMGVSGIVTILFLISLVVGLGVWVMYAYRNPHSTSGQVLIRYRPSQWTWKRGEARYTAATIHM